MSFFADDDSDMTKCMKTVIPLSYLRGLESNYNGISIV